VNAIQDNPLLEYVMEVRNEFSQYETKRTIGELSEKYQKNELILNYSMRELMHDKSFPYIAIEQLLLGVHNFHIIVSSDVIGEWHVYEGINTLHILFSFMGILKVGNYTPDILINNSFKMKGINIKEINGYGYNDLPLRLQEIFKNESINIKVMQEKKEVV